MANLYDLNQIQLAKLNVINLKKYTLRPLTLEDLLDYHDITSDKEALKYNYPAHKTIDESLIMLVKWHLSSPLGKYGIQLNETNKIIGIISVSLAENGTFCEIGYTMNRQFWRQGIAYKTLKKLINLLWLNLSITKIVAHVNKDNQPSIQLLKKLNFTENETSQTQTDKEFILNA